MILITSILKRWKNFNRERKIKNSFIPRVPVNPPSPPALPKDASALSTEANGECQDTNKDLSEKYLVFRRFNCSLATQCLLKHRKSHFVTKKSIFELASKRNYEKQIIIFHMFLSKIKIFLKIAFFSVYIHSFTFIHSSVATCRGSSPSPHRRSAQWETPPWGAQPAL